LRYADRNRQFLCCSEQNRENSGKGFDSRRTVKNKDIIIHICKIGEVIANGPVQDCLGVFDLVLIKNAWNLRLMNIRKRNQELLGRMLADFLFNQIFEDILAVKYLPFPYTIYFCR
jgi:hypothetical protein